MKIKYRQEALADLTAQLDHIAADSPDNAADVSRRIRESIKRLEIFPYSGREGAVVGTFELVIPRLPYIVVYCVSEFFEILAVFHTAQDRKPEDIKSHRK